MKKTALAIILFITFNPLNAQGKKENHANNIAVNVLAIPVKTGVVAYERYFNEQSIWLGFEHFFNVLDKEHNRNTNSFALEYRRYITGKSDMADGLFAAIYIKTRWGKESLPQKTSELHRYTVLFSGLNTGYQFHLKRLALSAFVGYGFPLAISEESIPKDNPNNFNEGYNRDLGLGLTIGFAF